MIKKLRSRFIKIATLSVAAVMLLLAVAVNSASFYSANSDLDKTINLIYENDGTKKFSKRIDATGDVIRLCYRDGILYAKVGRENLLPAFDRSGEVVSYGQEPEGGFAYGTFDGWTQKNGDSSFRFGTTGYRYSESSVFVKCFAGKGVNRLYLVTESGEEIELFRDEGHS